MSIGRIEMVDGVKKYVRYATLGGSGGVPVGNVKNISLEKGMDALTLKWSDPDNVVFNGETTAEWAGTKVLRKAGSDPQNVDDGIVIVDSKEKNQYAEHGLQDTNVVAGTEYNYALFPYTDKTIYTMSDTNRIRGSLSSYRDVLSDNTWEQIHYVCDSGAIPASWKLGDGKDGAQIIGILHDDKADGSGKAGLTFVANDKTFLSRWSNSIREIWTESEFYPKMINYYSNASGWFQEAKPFVKKVNKKMFNGITINAELIENAFYVFVPSLTELAGSLPTNKESEGEWYEGFKQGYGIGSNNFWTRTLLYTDSTTTRAYISNGRIAGATNSQLANGNYCKWCFCI